MLPRDAGRYDNWWLMHHNPTEPCTGASATGHKQLTWQCVYTPLANALRTQAPPVRAARVTADRNRSMRPSVNSSSTYVHLQTAIDEHLSHSKQRVVQLQVKQLPSIKRLRSGKHWASLQHQQQAGCCCAVCRDQLTATCNTIAYQYSSQQMEESMRGGPMRVFTSELLLASAQGAGSRQPTRPLPVQRGDIARTSRNFVLQGLTRTAAERKQRATCPVAMATTSMPPAKASCCTDLLWWPSNVQRITALPYLLQAERANLGHTPSEYLYIKHPYASTKKNRGNHLHVFPNRSTTPPTICRSCLSHKSPQFRLTTALDVKRQHAHVFACNTYLLVFSHGQGSCCPPHHIAPYISQRQRLPSVLMLHCNTPPAQAIRLLYTP
jgi:hypothetical protein